MNKTFLKTLGVLINFLSYFSQKLAAKIAFYIFCSPIRNKIKPYHLKFLNTAIQEDIIVNGNKVKMYQWGVGPKKVLFLHGWNSFTFRWKKHIEALNFEQYTIYAVDAPGCGLSEGKQLHALIYSELIRKVIDKIGGFDVVVAHSFGAVSTVLTLHEFENVNIKSAVLMGSPTEINHFFKFFIGQLNLNNIVYEGIRQIFLRKFGKEPSYFSLTKFAEKIDIPVLVIHDKNDTIAPFVGAEKMAHIFKNGSLFATEGFGHDLKDVIIINEIKRFIEKF